ncbi:unnamed protein product, partial [Vitis vinifera]
MYRLNLGIYTFSRKVCHQLEHTELNHHIRRFVNSCGTVHSSSDSNWVLSNLSKCGRVDDARKLFDVMPDRDECSWNTMIGAYANSGRLNEARKLFYETPIRSCITWSSLISGYCRYGCDVEALELFWEMQYEGERPNQFTWGSVLRVCSMYVLLEKGKQIHAHAIKTQFDSNAFVVTGLVDMYAKCKCILEAEYLFELAPDKRNHVLWTAMVTGYSQNGDGHKAIECFRDMRGEGIECNQFTFPSILTACGSISACGFGAQVHGCIVRSGFGANVFVGSALVDMYSKCGDLSNARRMLETMEVDDPVSWNSMIVGCVRQGLGEEALSLFRIMHLRHMKIDEFTYPSLVNNALVDMYAKRGYFDYAFDVFEKMTDKDVISWTSLVTGCVHNGSYEEALRLFCEMRIMGIHPDQIVIAAVLSALDNSLVSMYAKCGCIEDANKVFDSMEIQDVITWTALIVGYAQNGRGRDYFQSMEEVYGIKPGPEHYACMIDLLGRSGKLMEAKELLNQMAVQPDATVWKALLAACRVHGNVELGERAANNLFELEPKNAVPYVLLSNLYSAAGKWEEAAKTRRLMKLRGVSKEPGCSWIEMSSKVHRFMSEDRSHPRTAEIYSKVDEIMILIKEAGYVPDMNFALHDMDEEGKELGLAYHSEKLAVAFGLLTMPPGAPIRIFKNLRICGDCHTAMKYVSGVFHRHVILRDSNCFHHFREGACSCSDYW